MRLVELSTFLLLIENVVPYIHLKGDCNATEVFENAASIPDWSSCTAFKNRSKECGEGPKPPSHIYSDILNKDKWAYPSEIYVIKPPSNNYLSYEEFMKKYENYSDSYEDYSGSYEDYSDSYEDYYAEQNNHIITLTSFGNENLASPIQECMMDSYKVNLLSTFDKENRKITFDSNTVEYETDRFENTSARTTCAWIYGSTSASYRYYMSIDEFEITGCYDCSCGSLDIYASRPYTPYDGEVEDGVLLERLCTHNITQSLSFESYRDKSFMLLIKFQTNTSLPKKVEVTFSSTTITMFDEWTECKVSCGEGFQQRKIINSNKCTAIQFRSCWVGKCSNDEKASLDFSSTPVGNQCLRLMQTAQEKYFSVRASVSRFCGYANAGLGAKLEQTNMKYDRREILESEAQIDWNGCKSNATEECKATALDYVAVLSNVIYDDKLKSCNTFIVGKIFQGPNSKRLDDFLPYTMQWYLPESITMKEALSHPIDTWIASCK